MSVAKRMIEEEMALNEIDQGDRGPENPYEPREMIYEPSRRERDLAFQIRMVDWGIIFFLACLVGVVLVGIWASYKMVMG